jgi:hypothetical protein
MTISWKATPSFMVHCHRKERKNIEKPFEIFMGGFRTIKYIKRDKMLMTLEVIICQQNGTIAFITTID